MGWLHEVSKGNFEAFPKDLTFKEACQLALLVTGYESTGGVVRCMAVSQRVIGELGRKGRSRPSALDLWITLFAAQRCYRMDGYPPTDVQIDLFLELAHFLRLALKKLTPKQRAGLVSILGRDEVLG